MEDLGAALNNNPDLLFLGGGNPAQIPAVQAIFAQHWQAIGAQSAAVNKVCGVYQSPQGDEQLIAELQTLFRAQGLAVGAEHLALISGSQNALFCYLIYSPGAPQAARCAKNTPADGAGVFRLCRPKPSGR